MESLESKIKRVIENLPHIRAKASREYNNDHFDEQLLKLLDYLESRTPSANIGEIISNLENAVKLPHTIPLEPPQPEPVNYDGKGYFAKRKESKRYQADLAIYQNALADWNTTRESIIVQAQARMDAARSGLERDCAQIINPLDKHSTANFADYQMNRTEIANEKDFMVRFLAGIYNCRDNPEAIANLADTTIYGIKAQRELNGHWINQVFIADVASLIEKILGQKEAAIYLLDAAIAELGDHRDLYLQKGLLHLSIHDGGTPKILEDALECFEKSDPNSPVVHRAIAKVYELQRPTDGYRTNLNPTDTFEDASDQVIASTFFEGVQASVICINTNHINVMEHHKEKAIEAYNKVMDLCEQKYGANMDTRSSSPSSTESQNGVVQRADHRISEMYEIACAALALTALKRQEYSDAIHLAKKSIDAAVIRQPCAYDVMSKAHQALADGYVDSGKRTVFLKRG